MDGCDGVNLCKGKVKSDNLLFAGNIVLCICVSSSMIDCVVLNIVS